MWRYGCHGAGSRRVYRQHAAIAKGQRLAAQQVVTGLHAELAFMTNMLFQRDNIAIGQRQLTQRRAVRLGFHLRWMNAAVEIPDFVLTEQR